ncbi:hypothetical protein QJS10_CPB19g00862 [Acorus calamus]|uniref:Uncharacterized protein n=1 Tax=Acorus calamus TaxID=4465 RepID=A0AAV9CJI7_ACOCL|nr:hypothetical protein QJS10_CPB19g00862 [Acorus calamus]
MKQLNSSSTSLLLLHLLLFIHSVSSQTCRNTCGPLPLRYPFGGGPGCGDPQFQTYLTCAGDTLLFNTHTGSYPVDSIDYPNKILHVQDPSMTTCTTSSTCATTRFGLDWNAPFTFVDEEPVTLGPSFEMDLGKLKCESYVGVYGFNDQTMNPQAWKYGFGIKYRFSVENGVPGACGDCEASNGVCGYNGPYSSFVCSCANGINTTSNCYFAASWNRADFVRPFSMGIGLISLWSLASTMF